MLWNCIIVNIRVTAINMDIASARKNLYERYTTYTTEFMIYLRRSTFKANDDAI